MSFYKAIGRYQFNEQEIEEIGTGKKFTACGKNRLFSEDFYSVERFDYATPNGDGTTRFALFKFLLMTDGTSLTVVICDFGQGKRIIENNLDDLLRGTARPEKMLEELEHIQEIFEYYTDMGEET